MNKLLSIGICLFALAGFNLSAQHLQEPPSLVAQQSHWKQTHSVSGNCLISFPSNPEHMQQHMPLPEENTHLKYDVYVSGLDDNVVFMALIAEYPRSMSSAMAEHSLEGFLNGILTQNPNNKLIFADLIDYNGHKALDFFIRTQNVYFKGRAIMANNNLYLLAMECEMQHYQENQFIYFLNSFQLLK